MGFKDCLAKLGLLCTRLLEDNTANNFDKHKFIAIVDNRDYLTAYLSLRRFLVVNPSEQQGLLMEILNILDRIMIYI